MLVRRRRSRAGVRWYSLVYRLNYALGFTPWDRGVAAPELVELIEGELALSPGRALDIGCGTGTNSVYLAQHGWQVIGVDIVPRALSAARHRAEAAGVSPTFVQGDVTRLDELGLDPGFTLLVDVGCFHTPPADRRDAYVASVSAVAAPIATLMLFAFARRSFAPMEAGVTREEVLERFRTWKLISAQRINGEALSDQLGGKRSVVFAARWFDPWSYRLRRLSPTEVEVSS